MSLGIDYSSSDEDSNHTKSEANVAFVERQLQPNDTPVLHSSTMKQSMANPFDSNNYNQSSSESSEDESNETQLNANIDKSVAAHRLASAFSSAKDSSLHCLNDNKVSIFSNPFKEEENKERNQLERHVKMTDDKTYIASEGSNHKKMCWNFGKSGKCKFGNRCRFFHNDFNFVNKNIKNTKSNKRTGITDSLIPPAKALKTYYSHKTD